MPRLSQDLYHTLQYETSVLAAVTDQDIQTLEVLKSNPTRQYAKLD